MDEPLLPALPGYDNPQLIAHGTTALVFRARQTRLNRLVAIKVITVDTGSVPVDAARELATTVALSSQPHIVSIIDTGVTADERPYIVMEYCEGGSYAQILRQGGPLPVDDVIEVGIKIGEALHAAHQAGIVHRDVKPSNVLRSRYGPALTDFGIARAPDELSGTLTREMMTPHHASPEALVHQAQSGLSDVYSLASTMWTLLVGHPPFVDPGQPPTDMYAFRDRVLHDPLPAMSREEVPGWLVAELTRAMAKLPAERHASALDFAECIRRGSLGLAPSPPAHRSPAGTGHAVGVPAQAWPITEPPRYVAPLPAAPVSAEAAPVSAGAGPVPGGAGPVPGGAASVPGGAAIASARVPEVTAGIWPPPPPPGIEEGGWLGPPVASEPGEVETAHQRPSTRHFGADELRPNSSRRNGLVILLVILGVLGVAAGSALVLANDRPPGPGDPAGSVTTSSAKPSTSGSDAPSEVTVSRDGTTVTVRWTDPTAGSVSFIVSGTGPMGERLAAQKVPAGRTSATFTTLDPAKRYCFVVGAIYSVNRVAAADAVCTSP